MPLHPRFLSRRFVASSLTVFSLTVSHSAFAVDPDAKSIQNVLTGANQVMADANYGAGIKFGDIDTGIVPWAGFTKNYNGLGMDNVDKVNSGVCLNGRCTAGKYTTDGNGHGTFTASEIVGAVPSIGMRGVAPKGTMIAVQVLNAQGSGNSNDIINGIRYAVDHGAQVLNLSLGPTGTASQQQAFYQSIASAVNYAASKKAYIVFAGGNSTQNLAGGLNLSGFTDAAIQRILFTGSTNANKQISSFSNKPGAGKFVSTTGAQTNYSSMWVMADGENIWGASNSNAFWLGCTGYTCITQASGTSMTAPQGTGAIGLLLARWPVLITNGNAAKILEQTATDLGTAGIDATYGSGFMNLVQAWQPVGGLSAATGSGGTVSINSSGGASMLSGGAMGAMPHLTARLANYTAFDAYQRDFDVNLSGLVATRPTLSAAQNATIAPKVSTQSVHLANGSNLAFGNMEAPRDFTDVEHRKTKTEPFFTSFTDAAGTTIAAGSGFPASASFANALWGSDSAEALQSSELGVSSALSAMAEGGTFAAYGTQLDQYSRIAFSWSQTQEQDGISNEWTAPDARTFSTGVTRQLMDGWTGSTTFSLLDENNGLLGTTYASSANPVGLGNNHQSMSMGVSSSVALTGSLRLMVDAAIARADGASLTGGIISDVTPLYARTYGASLVQGDTFSKNDRLSLSVRSPLRVYSGSAALAVTSVDAQGIATTGSQRVSLKPDGNELNLTAGYEAPVGDNMTWNVSLEARRDADNIAGQSDVGARVGARWAF